MQRVDFQRKECRRWEPSGDGRPPETGKSEKQTSPDSWVVQRLRCPPVTFLTVRGRPGFDSRLESFNFGIRTGTGARRKSKVWFLASSTHPPCSRQGPALSKRKEVIVIIDSEQRSSQVR